MVSLPYGGIQIIGGADTISLTTTAALMDSWAESGGGNSPASGNANDGDPAVIPDYTNNRLKVQAPGIYLVTFTLSGALDTAGAVVARLRKNGTAYGYGGYAKVHVLTTASQLTFTAIVVVSASDALGTLATFANPSSSGFAGAGGAPKTLATLDVTLEMASGSQTITVVAASLTAVRVG